MNTNTTSSPHIRAGDPRYDELAGRGNRRFAGKPDVIRLVGTTDDVVSAVQEAVDAGHRIAVRSGGHNLENFVDHPDIHTVIDMSAMRAVTYDDEHQAFMIEPGATLVEAYQELANGWGVTFPGGLYPGVGVGGHVVGGGYGYLSRLHGLAVDHLYGVEVVVVDNDGHARSVIATADTDDPHRDLWWAHTGGGGGTFGVVTRYWLRSPGTAGSTPAEQLPPVPAAALKFTVEWDWSELDEQSFSQLVRNHGTWAAKEAGSESDYAAMYSEFYLWRQAYGSIGLEGVFAAGSDDERDILQARLTKHLNVIGEGTSLEPKVTTTWVPWLEAFVMPEGPEWGDFRMRVKDAYARQPLSDEQIAIVYGHLTRTDTDVLGAGLSVHTYGGAINTVATDATAIAQRDSVLKLVPVGGWGPDGEGEEAHLTFLSELYRDLFADTGGVPVPNDRTDGAYLNHPDLDLVDSHWNTSGVPWHELYHRGNYPRLQQVKAAWDPRNIFRHELSVRPS